MMTQRPRLGRELAREMGERLDVRTSKKNKCEDCRVLPLCLRTLYSLVLSMDSCMEGCMRD